MLSCFGAEKSVIVVVFAFGDFSFDVDVDGVAIVFEVFLF
jgi:uncharacterized protein YjfI (DUF2170 family)